MKIEQALNIFKRLKFDECEWFIEENKYLATRYSTITMEKMQEKLIDFIEEQQKEIQEYKSIVDTIEEFKRLKRPLMELVHEMNKFEDEFISKDKIREKIKTIKSYAYVNASKARMRDYACDKLKELLEEDYMSKEMKCEYCKKGGGMSILHDEEYNSLNIFIKNGLLWEKTNDMGVEINFCPMCGRKVDN